jgi:hypothetical protein
MDLIMPQAKPVFIAVSSTAMKNSVFSVLSATSSEADERKFLNLLNNVPSGPYRISLAFNRVIRVSGPSPTRAKKPFSFFDFSYALSAIS